MTGRNVLVVELSRLDRTLSIAVGWLVLIVPSVPCVFVKPKLQDLARVVSRCVNREGQELIRLGISELETVKTYRWS